MLEGKGSGGGCLWPHSSEGVFNATELYIHLTMVMMANVRLHIFYHKNTTERISMTSLSLGKSTSFGGFPVLQLTSYCLAWSARVCAFRGLNIAVIY